MPSNHRLAQLPETFPLLKDFRSRPSRFLATGRSSCRARFSVRSCRVSGIQLGCPEQPTLSHRALDECHDRNIRLLLDFPPKVFPGPRSSYFLFFIELVRIIIFPMSHSVATQRLVGSRGGKAVLVESNFWVQSTKTRTNYCRLRTNAAE